MVRMRGVLPIGTLRFLSASDFRVMHGAKPRVTQEVNARWRVGEHGRMLSSAPSRAHAIGQPSGPAFSMSHSHGSTTDPLMCTSKWQWLAVELPVLPTKPISCPAATESPTCTWRVPYVM